MQSRIAPAQPEDLIALVENLRALESRIPGNEHLLMQEFARSVFAWTGFFDDRPVVVWGLIANGVFSDDAMVWLVGSREIERHPLVFARHSLEAFALTKRYFKRLYGVVSLDFPCGARWLEWLGFTVEAPSGAVRRFEWQTR